MFEVKHRLLSGAIDENMGTLTAAVSLLGALKGLYSVDGSVFDALNYKNCAII